MKYKVNLETLGDLNCCTLIEAVCRYMNSTEYPELKSVLAILAISEEMKEGGENE